MRHLSFGWPALIAVVVLLGPLCGALAQPASAPSGAAAGEKPDSGTALYNERCGICHGPGGTGTFMLGRRLGTERALLARRTDLPEALIKVVVRTGINSMPVFTRAELTDAELELIVSFLTRPPEARPPASP